MEDREGLSTPSEKVEPLLDDEVEEVDGVGFVEDFVEEVWVVGLDGTGAVSEPDVGEGDSVTLHVPETHGSRDSR